MRQEKLSTSKKKTYATTAEVHAALMRLGAEIADIADTEFGNGYKVVISNGKIDVLYSEIGFPIGFEEE
jgi:hypothetical protein